MLKKFYIFLLALFAILLGNAIFDYFIPNLGSKHIVYASENMQQKNIQQNSKSIAGYNGIYKRGDIGEAVKYIQKLLNNYGYNLIEDGMFGPITERSVIDFQRKAGIGVDGIVGSITMNELIRGSKEQFSDKKLTNTEEQKYCFTNNVTSETEYIIQVDTEKQLVSIFKFNNNEWALEKKYPCSSGKASTPTPKGIYKVGAKGKYFRVGSKYICKYYTQFYGNYLFHSVILFNNGKIFDGTLGKPVSHGCVRLPIEAAKYIFDNVPKNTTVIIASGVVPENGTIPELLKIMGLPRRWKL